MTILKVAGVALLLSFPPNTLSYSGNRPPPNHPKRATRKLDRRTFLSFSAAAPFLALAAAAPPSFAFDNRLDDKYADATPKVGVQPEELGVRSRVSRSLGASYAGLAPCPGSPNCWCSSTPFGDAPARYIGPWRGKSIRDLRSVVDTYEVGQGGIDGGGFKVVEYDEEGQYLYVQFQSYKAGYIDDVEFWFNPEKNKFDVRSASRIGLSDLGVNAKRLEYIGGRLEKEFGWELERRKNGSLV